MFSTASYSDEHGIRKGVTSPIFRLVLFPDSPFNLESCCSSDESLFSLGETAYVLLPLVIPSTSPPKVINHAPFFVSFLSFITFFVLSVSSCRHLHHPEFIACSWKAVLLCVTHSRSFYHLVLLFDGVSVYFSEHFLGVRPQGSLGSSYVYNVRLDARAP